jgi:hypothetical protein
VVLVGTGVTTSILNVNIQHIGRHR